MYTNAQYQARDDRPVDDQIVNLHDLSWEDYERLLTMRGDCSAPRISYLDGEVEFMSPSRTHEGIKSLLGCLVETHCPAILILANSACFRLRGRRLEAVQHEGRQRRPAVEAQVGGQGTDVVEQALA